MRHKNILHAEADDFNGDATIINATALATIFIIAQTGELPSITIRHVPHLNTIDIGRIIYQPSATL